LKAFSVWLEDWQAQDLGMKALAASTFRVFTWAIRSLEQIQTKMISYNRVFELMYSVCSTLVVEQFFSILRSMLLVFRVLQYCYLVVCCRWELLTQKSKYQRLFGLPTDNQTRFNKLYGNINITTSKPKLQHTTNKHTPIEQKQDESYRCQVREISKEIHTNKESSKVRGGLYQFRGPSSLYIVHSKVYTQLGQLQLHLISFHEILPEEALQQATNVESTALQVELKKNRTSKEPIIDIPSIADEPVTQPLQLPHKPPFQ
jgi:hypothetical protein